MSRSTATSDTAGLRRQILDGALDLIIDTGVASLSFREVARRAGVSHQAPYHHFKDKKGVLSAIAEEGFQALHEAMRVAKAEASDDPRDRMRAIGRAYVNLALDRPGHYRVMFRPDLIDMNPEQPVQAVSEGAFGELTSTVAEMQAAGYGAQIPHHVLVVACWSVVHGVVGLLLDSVLTRKVPVAEAERRQLAIAAADCALGMFQPVAIATDL